jgi:hypothetical protein
MSTEPTALKTRSELKKLFQNGAMPTENHFASLIDAMVHRADAAPAAAPVRPAPAAPKPASGWARSSGRIGSYDPSQGPEQIERAVELAMASVPADGKLHPILRSIRDCYGFELVASASGLVNSSNHALTHAIVLISFRGRADGILQTASYHGWNFMRKIRVKWVARGDAYDLCIGTGMRFGQDEQGRPVRIQYHLGRIW